MNRFYILILSQLDRQAILCVHQFDVDSPKPDKAVPKEYDLSLFTTDISADNVFLLLVLQLATGSLCAPRHCQNGMSKGKTRHKKAYVATSADSSGWEVPARSIIGPLVPGTRELIFVQINRQTLSVL